MRPIEGPPEEVHMTEQERTALAAFAAKMSSAFAELSVAMGGDAHPVAGVPPLFGPATTEMAWNERVLRQSLILHEIVRRGGHVPQSVWYEIAARYGYTGRGLAGFFRREGQGLLDLRNKQVYITKRGKDRLKENQERVDAALASQSPAAAAVL